MADEDVQKGVVPIHLSDVQLETEPILLTQENVFEENESTILMQDIDIDKAITMTAMVFQSDEIKYIVYKQRWLVLLAYCSLTLAVTSTSTAFTAISNILQEFYDVKPIAIHILLALYAFMVVVFNCPASFLLFKFELGFILKLSASLNLIGGVIRYFSYDDNGYYFLLIGSVFSGLSLASFVFLPPTLAMNWFPKNESGKANGIAVGFDMFSAALGFIHSTNIVKNTTNDDDIRDGIKSLVLHQLIMAGIAFLITFMFVKSHPPTAPSFEADYYTRKVKTKGNDTNEETLLSEEAGKDLFTSSIKKLFKHRTFLLIIHIVTVSASLEYTYSAMLNDILIEIFPGMEREIGWVGFSAIILGFIGNIIVGLIIDRTKAYKTITQVIFLLSLFFLIMWTCFLEVYKNFIGISAAYCGFVMIATSYYSVANTHMVVVTHPISPGISSMLLMVVSSVYLIGIVFLSSLLLEYTSVLLVNMTAIVITIAATLITFCF